MLLANFDEVLAEPCGNCDTCLEPVDTWDATEAARKALSCVFRSGQRFGAAHLVDILRGADTERIAQFGHRQLSTYGIGQDLDARQWKGVFRQLVAMGLLEVDAEGFGALRLTAAARPVLRGEQSVLLRREQERKRDRGARSASATRADALLNAADAAVFEELRALRAGLAREQNLPAYVIFHDSTLREMATQRPATLDELGRINGVGASKLDRYGERMLAVLQEAEAT